VKNKIQRILVNTVGINNVDHVGAASLLTSAGHAHLPFFYSNTSVHYPFAHAALDK